MGWVKNCFCVLVNHHYSDVFEETMCYLYLRFLFFVNEIKCLWEIFKQLCCHKILCTYSFSDSLDCHNLWLCGRFIREPYLFFFNETFPDFETKMLGIISFSCYTNKLYICYSYWFRRCFFEKRKTQPFVHFSLVFHLYTKFHNRRSMLTNVLIFHTSRECSSRAAAFQLKKSLRN